MKNLLRPETVALGRGLLLLYSVTRFYTPLPLYFSLFLLFLQTLFASGFTIIKLYT